MSHSDKSCSGLGDDAQTGTGLHDFYTNMTSVERRTFWGCSMGWACDGLDFTIYPLVIGTIMALWHVDPGPAGLATTTTLLASALGGWMVGFLSDRIGRVVTLQLTIAWFGACTLLCGMAQDFTQLLIFRTLLGAGFGGEWAAGAVLMSETVRAEYRGRALGLVQSSWAVGWGAAVILQAIAFSLFEAATAWRAMFIFGCLPAAGLIWYLRRYVPEPEIAIRARRESEVRSKPPIWEIFSPRIRRTTLLAAFALTGAHGGYYAITSWLPAYLSSERGLTIVSSTAYLASLIIGSFAGYLMGAWLADRIGRRKLFLVFSLGAIAMILVYTQLEIRGPLLLLCGFPLGFFSSGYYSGAGAFLAELFPTRLRGSGQGFTYNFGRGVGALFPALVGYLSNIMPLGSAMTLFAVTAYSVFFLTAFALPETRGRVLHA